MAFDDDGGGYQSSFGAPLRKSAAVSRLQDIEESQDFVPTSEGLALAAGGPGAYGRSSASVEEARAWLKEGMQVRK